MKKNIPIIAALSLLATLLTGCSQPEATENPATNQASQPPASDVPTQNFENTAPPQPGDPR
ncbi:MAG: hypothetical protein MUC92_03040 [Fimbriimonadaceae bacterium]|nr:hypothetical protein [Fimbriimonadaceae bacterium]